MEQKAPEQIIFEYAAEKGLIYGICDSEALVGCEELLLNKDVPFVSSDVRSRIDPKKIMPEAQSVIVLGMGYNKELDVNDDGVPRGVISVGAVGTDYHVLLKGFLCELVCALGITNHKIFVDSGPLLERELAKKAGLGFSGKNCCLISPKLGSFFYIGYAVTDMSLAPTPGYEIRYNRCGGCTRCIEACPGGALSEFSCDYRKCVSYLTQYKGQLSEEQQRIMGLSIYGCDVCQRVCPFNDGKYTGRISDIDAVRPELTRIAHMDKQYFEMNFKATACGWRGKNILKRNASIALRNYSEIKNRI